MRNRLLSRGIKLATFLLKLHSAANLGGAEPRPKKAGQWEGIRLNFLNPSKASVSEGDSLIVWTHEADSFGRGYGLTAEGTASNISIGNTHTQATLTNVELLSPHFALKGWPEGKSTGSAIINRLRGHILEKSYLLNEGELAEFRTVINEFRGTTARLIQQTNSGTTVDGVLVRDKTEIFEGLERRFALQEVRPEQAAFRADVLSRYAGKCAISGCRIEAVLQAAHILPFSEHVEFRNDVTNGLLLRADVHILFDRALISIDPANYKVVLAPALLKSSYSSFSAIQIPKVADERFLRTHYSFFKKQHQLPTKS